MIVNRRWRFAVLLALLLIGAAWLVLCAWTLRGPASLAAFAALVPAFFCLVAEFVCILRVSSSEQPLITPVARGRSVCRAPPLDLLSW